MNTYQTLNDMLVCLFREIMELEQNALIKGRFKNITNNDMHIIEKIGKFEEKSMSEIAKSLKVTVGTLTIAVQQLVKKGYVLRKKSEQDRRVVLISLSPLGVEAFERHQNFHKKMVEDIIKELDKQELEILVKTLVRVESFFKKYEIVY